MGAVASNGCDGVVCFGVVGVGKEDRERGVVGLRHVQDLWSARSCFNGKNTLVNTPETIA